jgi:hypothetical protein
LAVIVKKAVGLLDEQPELGLVACRADMPHDPPPTVHRLRDLDRRAPEAVRTRRTQAIHQLYRPELVPLKAH